MHWLCMSSSASHDCIKGGNASGFAMPHDVDNIASLPSLRLFIIGGCETGLLYLHFASAPVITVAEGACNT
jgi:hypothetical protein